MEAPDKIYLIDFPALGMSNHWYEKQQPVENLFIEGKNVEYISKDFLLEWAEQEKSKTSIGLSEYDAGHENGRMELLNDLIDKINTL